ncbi:hypothetical protein CF319_g5916 [Tilletia indica]|nr:hypothetical protein CF319_g5916 [Tilletia indica]
MDTITLTLPQLMQLLQQAARIGAQQSPVIPRPPTSDGKFEAIFAALGGDPATLGSDPATPEAPPVQNSAHILSILGKLAQALSMPSRDASSDSVHASPLRSMDRQSSVGQGKSQRQSQSNPYHRSPTQQQSPSAPFYSQFHQQSPIPQAPSFGHPSQHNNFAFHADFTLPVAPGPPSTPPPRHHFDINSPSAGQLPASSNPSGNCMFEGMPNTDPMAWNSFMNVAGNHS